MFSSSVLLNFISFIFLGVHCKFAVRIFIFVYIHNTLTFTHMRHMCYLYIQTHAVDNKKNTTLKFIFAFREISREFVVMSIGLTNFQHADNIYTDVVFSFKHSVLFSSHSLLHVFQQIQQTAIHLNIEKERKYAIEIYDFGFFPA